MGDNKISEAAVEAALDALDANCIKQHEERRSNGIKIAEVKWIDYTRAQRLEAIRAAVETAFSHLQGEAVPVAWQSMESAPKDGTAVFGMLEGSDIPQAIRFRGGWEIAWDGYRIPAHDGPLCWCPLYAPIQQETQSYLERLDRDLEEVIDQRDRYHEIADDLAGHIAAITGVDIGEHSSANCPWQNAIEAAEHYAHPQPAELNEVSGNSGELGEEYAGDTLNKLRVLLGHMCDSSVFQPPNDYNLGFDAGCRMAREQAAVGDEDRAEIFRKGWEAGNAAQALSSIATRKLEELAAQGYVTNGVAIFNPATGKRGLVDNLGYVGWQGAQGVDLEGVLHKAVDLAREGSSAIAVIGWITNELIDGRDAGTGVE